MNARALLVGILVVANVATVWSLSLSGIGPTGWQGARLTPCELCWYQRILMYPIPLLAAVALWRRDDRGALYVLPLAILGLLVAGYHILLQANPSLEAGQCIVGSCTLVERTWFGFTIPKLSAVAFALVIALGAGSLLPSPGKQELMRVGRLGDAGKK